MPRCPGAVVDGPRPRGPVAGTGGQAAGIRVSEPHAAVQPLS